MKEIMAKSSSSHDQGVPSFTFSPAVTSAQGFLFELNRPLDDLRAMLLKHFAGKTVKMRAIYMEHSVDRRYLAKNYKDVLKTMQKDGAITTSGRKSNHGFADEIMVTFPKKRT